jgi:hypothetical protein
MASSDESGDNDDRQRESGESGDRRYRAFLVFSKRPKSLTSLALEARRLTT